MLFFFAAELLGIGRFEKDSLPDQVRMELLVSRIYDTLAFRNLAGDFEDIERWYGVCLDKHGHVESIHWEYDPDFFQLDGHLQFQRGGSIGFEWLPTKLQCFVLSYMEMRGSIDTSCLPRGLENLNCEKNQIDGTFSIESLPHNISEVYVDCNCMHGTLRLQALPRRIEVCYLSHNAFSGIIDLSKLPEELRILHLNNNKFVGPISLDNLPNSVEDVALQSNCFSQQDLLVGQLSLNLGRICLDRQSFSQLRYVGDKAPRIIQTNGDAIIIT